MKPANLVGYVPYCHTDGHDCIVGEFRMDEFQERAFEVAAPEYWECRAVYLEPPSAARMPVERIAMLWNSLPIETDPQSVVEFVRAIEDFHGISRLKP